MTVALSIAAARRPGKWIDQLVRLFCVASLGLPSFWLGLMLIILFSLRLKLFPVSGFGRLARRTCSGTCSCLRSRSPSPSRPS